jgi:hypothetical protein
MKNVLYDAEFNRVVVSTAAKNDHFGERWRAHVIACVPYLSTPFLAALEEEGISVPTVGARK